MARKRKARRSYGTGRIFLRGSRWYVQYRGKRYATGSVERSAAEELLSEKLRQFSRGEIGGNVLRIEDVLDDYLKRGKFAPGTLATYESQARKSLKPFFGLLPAVKLTTDTISDYRDMREKAVSPNSVNRELALLRAALKDLHERRPKLLPSVPHFPMASERGNERQGFIREDALLNKLVPELPYHLKALTVCAFYCGARLGEWLKLTWGDVDFERRVIRFPADITKNRKAREVPILDGPMKEELLSRLIPDSPRGVSGFVFTYNGKPLRSIGSAWEKACWRAGLAGLHFHDLRRSANKFQQEQGLTQAMRMKLNGHLTDSMDRRYSVSDDVDLEMARERLNRGRA